MNFCSSYGFGLGAVAPFRQRFLFDTARRARVTRRARFPSRRLPAAAARRARQKRRAWRRGGTASLDGNVIRTVFVAPDAQGHGVGKRLMATVEQTTRDLGMRMLTVPSSVTAEQFYAKLGLPTQYCPCSRSGRLRVNAAPVVWRDPCTRRCRLRHPPADGFRNPGRHRTRRQSRRAQHRYPQERQ